MASKITIKRSLTAAAPAGLSFGEMAFVQGSGLTANQLYVGISGGNPVWVGAQIGTTGTWTDNAAKTSLATQFAIEERIGAKITASATGVSSFNGVTGAVTGVSSFNGLTGAVSGVGSIVAGTGISISGATGAVTVNSTYVPSLATTGVTGVASFNSADFAVSGAGDVTIKAAGVGNAQLENPNITINGGLIALGATYNFKISDFNTATSAELVGKISDPTGTGVIVLATSPTLVTPALGTPTALVGTNITGTASGLTAGNVTTNANLTGAITSTGNATVLGTSSFSSANLLSALSTKTGTGLNVFDTSPTLVTPTLGAAVATTINKVTITAPATASTITITDNKTLAVTNTLTLTGTDGSSVAFGAGGTVAYTATSVGSFNGATGAVTGVASFNGLTGAVGGVTTSVANTFTAVNTFSAGISANGGTFGTPTQLVGTNITGTATGFTVGSASLATNSLSLGGTAASGWAQLASPTFTGTVNTSNLTVGGNLTVSGTTTTINSTTLTIDDFNIIVGATLSGAGASGTEIATGAGIAIGTGTGISFAYQHSSTSWLSTVNLNVLSGKSYKIAGTEVLNSSALGAGITGSSLTQVGTITLGTWNGTAITDTYLAQITTGGKVANSATTATNLNTASAIVARDGSGNFTAGTIIAALTGNVSGSAATVTGAAQSAITSVGTLTSLTVSGTLEAGLIDGGTF